MVEDESGRDRRGGQLSITRNNQTAVVDLTAVWVIRALTPFLSVTFTEFENVQVRRTHASASSGLS